MRCTVRFFIVYKQFEELILNKLLLGITGWWLQELKAILKFVIQSLIGFYH